MKKTPPTEAPAQPKEDPVPEKPESVKVSKASDERAGLQPGPQSHPDEADLWHFTGDTGALGSALDLGEYSGQLGRPSSSKRFPMGKNEIGGYKMMGADGEGGAEVQDPCPEGVTVTFRVQSTPLTAASSIPPGTISG